MGACLYRRILRHRVSKAHSVPQRVEGFGRSPVGEVFLQMRAIQRFHDHASDRGGRL